MKASGKMARAAALFAALACTASGPALAAGETKTSTGEAAKSTPLAQAKPAPAPATPATVHVLDQDLRAFIADLARRSNLRADIQPVVKGRIMDQTLPTDFRGALSALEKQFDFEWTMRDGIVRITQRAETVQRILPIGRVRFADIQAEARTIDFDVSRYPIKHLSRANAVSVSAPAAQIDRIASLIEALKVVAEPPPAKAPEQKPPQVVQRVVPATPPPPSITVIRAGGIYRDVLN